MFTGIVEEIGKVKAIARNSISIEASMVLSGTKAGDSINTNGACLTAVTILEDGFIAEIMPETLSRTVLGELKSGDEVNLERSLRLDDRVGGHFVTGHVDCVVNIIRRRNVNGETRLEISLPEEFSGLVVEKGSIGVEGVSLTVAVVSKRSFEVALTSFTSNSTTLGKKRTGEKVNLEFDLIGKYVNANLKANLYEKPMEKLLKEGGYV